MDPETPTDTAISEVATDAPAPVDPAQAVADIQTQASDTAAYAGANPAEGVETLSGVDTGEPVSTAEATVQNLLDMVANGGPVVWLLIAFSVLALTVIFFKLGQLLALRQRPGRSVDKALARLQADDLVEAQRLVSGQSNARAQVVHRALAMHEAGHFSVAEIRDEATRIARLGIAQRESHLRILEVVAMLAPLLGLFGTVLGMIEAFRAMEAAGAQVNPAILSGGIWQALLTTAAGLAVAIPVSIAHSWFERKLEVHGGRLQNDIDVLTSIIGHSQKQRAVTPIVRHHIQRAAS